MAIEKPRIVAGPAKQRNHVVDQPVLILEGAPGESYLTTDENGFPKVVVVQVPERVGQVYFHQIKSQGMSLATMYVAVRLASGFIQWKPVGTGNVVNSYTGRPVDAIYD